MPKRHSQRKKARALRQGENETFAKMGEKILCRSDLARGLADRIAGRRLGFLDHDEMPGIGLHDLDTGEVLEDCQAGDGLDIRLAAYLLEGANSSNLYAGELDGGEAGTFHGQGAQWHGSLRLDPFWSESMRRRSRNHAKERLKEGKAAFFSTPGGKKEAEAMVKLVHGRPISWRLHWDSVTLTFPHGEKDWGGMSSIEQMEFVNGAFRRLTRSEWWLTWGKAGNMRRVILGIKGMEDDLTWTGPHVHIHLLLLTRFMDKAELANEWRKALNAEAKSRRMKQVDTLPHVKVKEILTSRPGEGEDWISLEGALDEVTKYITKTSNLLEGDEQGRQVPREALLELCLVERWPRMFELLGAARAAPAPKALRLDTSCISGGADAGFSNGNLDQLLLNPPEALVRCHTPEEFECTLLNVWILADRVLHPDRHKRPRPPSWRDLMYVLDLEDWLIMLRQRVQSGRKFRIAQLARLNPVCRIMDATGQVLVNQSHESQN